MTAAMSYASELSGVWDCIAFEEQWWGERCLGGVVVGWWLVVEREVDGRRHGWKVGSKAG